MSLGNSNMAGNALRTAFHLLLLASIVQGLRDVELFHHKRLKDVVGQNITLPCIVKKRTDLKIVSIEWSKKNNETTKLTVYSPVHGHHPFWPNVTIQIRNNEANQLMGSELHLHDVTTWDSGIYICDITTFPLGSIRTETELIIEDEIMCDVDGTVEVRSGDNVAVHCRALPNSQYKWTKNQMLVSEETSLELWWVTDADAGVYNLTVNTGNKTMHKVFIITVLTATTSLRTDHMTTSSQGLTETADSSFTTPVTTEFPTQVNWTPSISTSDPHTTSDSILATQHTTSSTHSPTISVTSSPATHSDTHHLLNSTTYGSTVSTSTQEVTSDEIRNESKPHTRHPEDVSSSVRPEESTTIRNISENPDATPTLRSKTVFSEDQDAEQNHLLLVLIMIPMLVLIVLVGLLCRRQMLKRRMDLPPPFKPPPPPVKYTAVRRTETSTQSFPTSRCNSVIEPKDMRQMFINI